MLSQFQVLRTNKGNVFLHETDDQSSMTLLPTNRPLPSTRPAHIAFDSNPSFKQAKQTKKPYVAFPSKSGHSVLVCPLKPYSSIRDFAMRASRSEWEQFFQYVYAVRNALQKKVGGFFYIETIGFHVPHLHIRLVRRKM